MSDWWYQFPDPAGAGGDGLVAVTEEVTGALLQAAYCQGLFPWTSDPVGWFCPDPRAVFDLQTMRLPSNLPRLWRRSGLTITCDLAFAETMVACRQAHRADGQWISDAFVAAYGDLFARCLAHSVEVWRGPALVGGIYGVHIGGLFAGESMFHRVSNASKFALAVLVTLLRQAGVTLFDVQVPNPHTARLGARLVSRRHYLGALAQALRRQVPAGRWPPRPDVDRALAASCSAGGAPG